MAEPSPMRGTLYLDGARIRARVLEVHLTVETDEPPPGGFKHVRFTTDDGATLIDQDLPDQRLPDHPLTSLRLRLRRTSDELTARRKALHQRALDALHAAARAAQGKL